MIDENSYSTYSQVVHHPYYGDRLYRPCLHRLEGIPSGAFVAVVVIQWRFQYFTVSNGTHEQNVTRYNNPVFMKQTDGTNTLLLNISAANNYRRGSEFQYKYRGKW